jgi:hypothetical protein
MSIYIYICMNINEENDNFSIISSEFRGKMKQLGYMYMYVYHHVYVQIYKYFYTYVQDYTGI